MMKSPHQWCTKYIILSELPYGTVNATTRLSSTRRFDAQSHETSDCYSFPLRYRTIFDSSSCSLHVAEDMQQPPITLRAVFEIFKTFLRVVIHIILQQRSLYPPDAFTICRKCNILVYECCQPGVCEWMERTVNLVEEQLPTMMDDSAGNSEDVLPEAKHLDHVKAVISRFSN